MSAYLDALKLLGRRELSAAQMRDRLLDREHAPDDVDAAIARLREGGTLDDRRVARVFARTAVKVKGRGRLRIQRELHAMGIDRETAAEALAEVFGDIDERSLVARAIQKKLRGGPRPASRAERARLYQFLMRQGFSPAVIVAALGRRAEPDDE